MKREYKKKDVEVVVPKFKHPLVIETIKSTVKLSEKNIFVPKVEKIEVKGSVPTGHIRAIVLLAYEGMKDNLVPGDIIDIPERRFKSLSFRGLVKEYNGKILPNKER